MSEATPNENSTVDHKQTSTLNEINLPTHQIQQDQDNIPDGGWKAWSVVVGGWCAMFVSVGWNQSVGIFQTIYENGPLKSYSPSTIGWIGSLQTFIMFACAPIWGKIFDSYGPRYTLFVGTLIHVFGLMMMSLSTQYYQFILSQSVCTGIGAGAIFFSSSNTTVTWFKRNRALALGIASSGSAGGGAVIPIMVNHLYHSVGFGWALRSTSFVLLVLLTITNLLVKPRLKPIAKKLRVMDFIDPFKELRYLFLSLACFTFAMAVYLPNTFIILDATSRHMNVNIAGYLLAILNASSAIGRIIAGRLADKIGRFNCMILTTFLSSVFVLSVWIPAKSTVILILFAILIGFTNGAFVSLVSALVAQISDLKQIGTRNGTNWLVYGLGALIGTPTAGALIQRNEGGYLYMQIFAGIAMFTSSCFFLSSRAIQIGLAWRWI